MRHGAGVLLIKNGKVLLVRAGTGSKQITGTMSFPGGTIEDGETVEQAAQREFQEETGLTATELLDFPGNYVEDKLQLKGGEIEFSFKVFLTRDFSGELKATDETEPVWATIDEAKELNLLGRNNEILEHAINFLKS